MVVVVAADSLRKCNVARLWQAVPACGSPSQCCCSPRLQQGTWMTLNLVACVHSPKYTVASIMMVQILAKTISKLTLEIYQIIQDQFTGTLLMTMCESCLYVCAQQRGECWCWCCWHTTDVRWLLVLCLSSSNSDPDVPTHMWHIIARLLGNVFVNQMFLSR